MAGIAHARTRWTLREGEGIVGGGRNAVAGVALLGAQG